MPVREALRVLESEGLVESIPHRSVLVTDISIEDVRELGMIRRALEGMATELATARMDTAKVGELQSLLVKMELLGDPPKDETAYLAAHRAFHLGLYEAAGLPRLSKIVTSLWEASERYRRTCTLLPDRRKEAAQEHRTILEACRMKDGPMARHLMEGHLSRTTEMTIELLSRRT
jgi:DNA-binding GntR family transcriptional regulator